MFRFPQGSLLWNLRSRTSRHVTNTTQNAAADELPSVSGGKHLGSWYWTVRWTRDPYRPGHQGLTRGLKQLHLLEHHPTTVVSDSAVRLLGEMLG